MIGITKSELRTIVRDVFLSRFVESDEEFLEETVDMIIEEVEAIEEVEEDQDRD